MRTIARALAVALLATLLGAGAVAPAAAEPCATAWGTGTRIAAVQGSAVRTVRIGTDACWDRVVFDLAGPVAGYHVTYVDEVTQEVRGGDARVRRREAAGHAAPPGGRPAAYLPARRCRRRLPDAALRGLRRDLEGSTIGIGLRERLPFRVFTLTGPDRLVVDIAHR